MECNKVLLDSVNKNVQKNMGKAIIALLVVIICTSVIAPVALVSAMVGGASFFSVLMLLLCVSVSCMLFLGFAILLSRFYRNQQAVLGYIFVPFKDIKRMGSVALLFSAGITIISLIVTVVGMSVYLPEGLAGLKDIENILPSLMKIMPLLSVICILFFIFLVVFPNIFVWLVLIDNPEISAFEALKESFLLAKGKRIRLLGFLLQCGGWWLLAGCLALAVTICFALFFTPLLVNEFANSVFSFVGLVCDGIYFIGLYTAVIKIITGVVAFYDELKSDLEPKQEKSEEIYLLEE